MTFSRNHYELLGVSSFADGETLHKAFRQLSKELHPDTTSLPKDEAANRFQQVCEAYELLADPISRKAYDLKLEQILASKQKLAKESEFILRNSLPTKSIIGARRPLSGGEMFSLLLLLLAFLLSLLLGIGFAFAQGRELTVRPTWLIVGDSIHQISVEHLRDGFITSKQNSIKSTLFRSP